MPKTSMRNLFVDFSDVFDSIHRGKMEQIHLARVLFKETVAAIMMIKTRKLKFVHRMETPTSWILLLVFCKGIH